MHISLINHALSLPTPTVLTEIAAALQIQMQRDFAPAWGQAPSQIDVDGSGIQVVIFDTADQAGVLGYHDRDPHGNPYARVFAQPVLDHGGDWATRPLSVASVISHEVLEILADPDANRWADNGTTKLWALEVCDPCESTAYAVNGVTVSDFVFPSWFDPGARRPYDFRSQISKPFGLAKGGYAIVSHEGAVSQVFGDESPEQWRLDSKQSPVSRTARRLGRS